MLAVFIYEDTRGCPDSTGLENPRLPLHDEWCIFERHAMFDQLIRRPALRERIDTFVSAFYCHYEESDYIIRDEYDDDSRDGWIHEDEDEDGVAYYLREGPYYFDGLHNMLPNEINILLNSVNVNFSKCLEHWLMAIVSPMYSPHY